MIAALDFDPRIAARRVVWVRHRAFDGEAFPSSEPVHSKEERHGIPK